MKNYDHIEKMEAIMNWHADAVRALESQLTALDQHRADYAALMAYYYSEQRNQDLDDDANDLIPKEMRRGVLSEDELFDLMGEYRDAALHMLETAVHMLKA